MANPIVEKAKERMTQSHQSLGREFGSIRAGRANASLLDRIFVEYYGVETPLNQLASITIPEARVLLITPFDKSSLKDIEHSINASDLGITPANDGSVIRLVIPALTEETRRARQTLSMPLPNLPLFSFVCLPYLPLIHFFTLFDTVVPILSTKTPR